MSEIKISPKLRNGEPEKFVLTPFGNEHESFEVGSTGSIYDQHLTSEVKGGKKKQISPW